MILKKIAHKVAQAFRLAQTADKKLSTGIAAALDAKAEQLREYEKSFEPEPPEPDPLLEARTSLVQAGFSAAAATYALRRFAEGYDLGGVIFDGKLGSEKEEPKPEPPKPDDQTGDGQEEGTNDDDKGTQSGDGKEGQSASDEGQE